MKLHIPYYMRRRIIHHMVNVVMLLFLALTLLPIGWMVYASFKENNDILVGKVGYSRAKNPVRAIQEEGGSLYVCTDDGGINKFEAASGKFLAYTSIRTAATNFTFDEKHVWVSSGNRFLTRVDKDNFKKTKDFKLPLKDLDRGKIASTMLIREGDILWFSMRYRGFEGIIEFNKATNSVSRIIDLANELSPVQVISLAKEGGTFWVGTDKGILEVSAGEGKVKRALSTLEMLPQGISEIAPFRGGLLFGGSTGLYSFSPKTFGITGKYDAGRGLISSQIESLTVDGNDVFVGTNAGLSILDSTDGSVRNYRSLFNIINEKDKVVPGTFTTGIVTSVKIAGSKAYLGSSTGRVTVLDAGSGRIIRTLVGNRGRLVIAWRNYVDMWKNINFGLYLRNSFIICGATMILSMFFATLAAYSISRFKFPGANLFSISILATQMVPGMLLLIPLYITFIKFSEWTGIPLKGTFYGIIFIYSAFFVPFSIWILRGFFAAIPIELEEAARIDGCSPIQVFWYIVLPLAIPGIIATGIYVFLTAWDELMFAWILTSADTMTIPVGIRNFVGNYQNRFDLLMAAATVATIPVMVLFFLLQKHIVKGLTAGAVKG